MAMASGATKMLPEIPVKRAVQSLIQVVYNDKPASGPVEGASSSFRCLLNSCTVGRCGACCEKGCIITLHV